MQAITLYEDDGLKVYVMQWCWAFCRKLDCFNSQDRNDIVALLTYLEHATLTVAQMGDIEDATKLLWTWIEEDCPLQIENWRVRNFVEIIEERILKVVVALTL